MSEQWLPISDCPGDGDSIWVVVIEWDGVNTHVEYAQTWENGDGLYIHRYEGEDNDEFGERWPPNDIKKWQMCDVPEFIVETAGKAREI